MIFLRLCGQVCYNRVVLPLLVVRFPILRCVFSKIEFCRWFLQPHLLQMPFPWVVSLDLHSSSSHHQAFHCEFLAIRRTYSQPNRSWGLINRCHHVSSVRQVQQYKSYRNTRALITRTDCITQLTDKNNDYCNR